MSWAIKVPSDECHKASLIIIEHCPDRKVHGANMGPTWVLSTPDEPHVGPMNLAIRVVYVMSRQQTTLADVDPVGCCHMTTPGHNELIWSNNSHLLDQGNNPHPLIYTGTTLEKFTSLSHLAGPEYQNRSLNYINYMSCYFPIQYSWMANVILMNITVISSAELLLFPGLWFTMYFQHISSQTTHQIAVKPGGCVYCGKHQLWSIVDIIPLNPFHVMNCNLLGHSVWS